MIPILLIAITSVINFVNFMDGIDGLVAGCMCIAIAIAAFIFPPPCRYGLWWVVCSAFVFELESC